ncbi:hypothetical protein EV424DRAFT_1431125 [Suillus variegatus]|nr:hypothetical protein EV424DRAFT_1431125 [Suillus variegatus]
MSFCLVLLNLLELGSRICGMSLLRANAGYVFVKAREVITYYVRSVDYMSIQGDTIHVSLLPLSGLLLVFPNFLLVIHLPVTRLPTSRHPEGHSKVL